MVQMGIVWHQLSHPKNRIKELHLGPSQIADKIRGINPKLILIIGVFIETNLASTTKLANKKAANKIFFILLACIDKYFQLYYKIMVDQPECVEFRQKFYALFCFDAVFR